MLDVGEGGPLRVFATHLGLGRIERRFQTMQLAKLIDAMDPKQPCLILGDMNEWFGSSRHLRWLDRRLGPSGRACTFPSRYPLFKLDRVWIRPREALLDVTAHDTPLARRASDHLPLRASLETTRLGFAPGPA